MWELGFFALLVVGCCLYVLLRPPADQYDEFDADEVSELARDLGLGPVYRTCDECGGRTLIDDGAIEHRRWLCADCLMLDGLKPRGNVVRLDDHRRAS